MLPYVGPRRDMLMTGASQALIGMHEQDVQPITRRAGLGW